MKLSLSLPKDQQSELLTLAKAYSEEIEKLKLPTAKTLTELKASLKEVLFSHQGVEDIVQKSKTTPQLLTLSHKDTVVRNLPWQVAIEESDMLAIAKTYKEALPAHKPSVGYPLKVLVMVAAPEGITRLAYEEEELLLLRAFSPLMTQGLVEVHFTDNGTLENLQEKLEENKYHILHFSGHGIYKDGKGYLALEDPETGRTQLVSSLDFNKVLAKVGRKGHQPDLVVLSACQTAQGEEVGDLSGVADTLMQGDIPAVIAMANSILDKCATEFARVLYSQLSEDYPLSDAFLEARLAVRKLEIETFKPAEYGLSPAQWLIPQFLLNEQVEVLVDKNSPKEPLDLKNEVKYIKGEQELLNLRVRPQNYVFIGRRKEKYQAFRYLKDGKSILLRGQGGVGKTALAEHLAIRIMASNSKIKVFTFSQEKSSASALLDQMQNYLTKEKQDFKVVRDLALIDKQTDKFFDLLSKVSEYCNPVFLFDNIESFQEYDKAKDQWVWNQGQHMDVLELIHILDQSTLFPFILTGRYPIAEFPGLGICNLNTVPFSDFFRKCHQMQFRKLDKTLASGAKPNYATKKAEGEAILSFEDIARLLHQSIGGNYRALEFFDELYQQKGKAVFETLEKLDEKKKGLNSKAIEEGVLAKMAKNLIFEELLAFLNETDLDTLLVLAQFNIPVLPMAIGMQRNKEDRSASLEKLVNLTLVERKVGGDKRERYYVIPLVKDLLKEKKDLTATFNCKLAGDYHSYIFDNKLTEDGLVEHTEAFENYHQAKAIAELNIIGDRLCKYYYDIQQFQLALSYGIRTEEIAQEQTQGRIWSNLGIIFQLYGKLDLALQYQLKALEDYKKRGDRQGEGSTLNNISQIYQVRGAYDVALGYLEQSLQIQQEIGDREGGGVTLNNISQIYAAKGDYDKAMRYLEQVLIINREQGDREGEGATLNNISQIYQVRGAYDVALGYLEQSLQIQQEIGDRQGEGVTLSNISQIHRVRGAYDVALGYLEQSLQIQQEIGDRKGEGTTLNNISQISAAKGAYDVALGYLEQSLQIQQEIGDRKGEGTTLNNLGFMLFEQNQIEQSIPYLLQAYGIFNQLGSPNQDMVASWLKAVIEKLGEERFNQILEALQSES